MDKDCALMRFPFFCPIREESSFFGQANVIINPVRLTAVALLLGLVGLSPTQSAEVRLGWDANPEPDIAGYRVYFGENSGIYDNSVDAKDATEALVAGLDDGYKYYFVVTAYNSHGLESLPSEEVSSAGIEFRVSDLDADGGQDDQANSSGIPNSLQAELDGDDVGDLGDPDAMIEDLIGKLNTFIDLRLKRNLIVKASNALTFYRRSDLKGAIASLEYIIGTTVKARTKGTIEVEFADELIAVTQRIISIIEAQPTVLALISENLNEAPARLTIQRITTWGDGTGEKRIELGFIIKITWDQQHVILQRSTDLSKPWTNVEGAASPYWLQEDGEQTYFRILTESSTLP